MTAPRMSQSEVEQRILDRLRAAAGVLKRWELREAIHPCLRAAALDAALRPLIARGLVREDRTTWWVEYAGRWARVGGRLYALTRRERPRKDPH